MSNSATIVGVRLDSGIRKNRDRVGRDDLQPIQQQRSNLLPQIVLHHTGAFVGEEISRRHTTNAYSLTGRMSARDRNAQPSIHVRRSFAQLVPQQDRTGEKGRRR